MLGLLGKLFNFLVIFEPLATGNFEPLEPGNFEPLATGNFEPLEPGVAYIKKIVIGFSFEDLFLLKNPRLENE